jgi:hypothetical protein
MEIPRLVPSPSIRQHMNLLRRCLIDPKRIKVVPRGAADRMVVPAGGAANRSKPMYVLRTTELQLINLYPGWLMALLVTTDDEV